MRPNRFPPRRTSDPKTRLDHCFALMPSFKKASPAKVAAGADIKTAAVEIITIVQRFIFFSLSCSTRSEL